MTFCSAGRLVVILAVGLGALASGRVSILSSFYSHYQFIGKRRQSGSVLWEGVPPVLAAERNPIQTKRRYHILVAPCMVVTLTRRVPNRTPIKHLVT
jgi:hypothetical protein